jgi:predicted O-methyltransferase YrrM
MKDVLRRTLPPPVWRATRGAVLVAARGLLGAVLRLLRASGYANKGRLMLAAFDAHGLNVASTSDYYSPLPVVAALEAKRKRWYKPSAMAGVDYDVDAMKAMLRRLLEKHSAEFERLPAFDENVAKGYGPGFTELDAMVLYLLVRELRPKRWIEIGSGLSTYYCLLAAAANGEDGAPLEVTCIDPYRTEALAEREDVEIMQREVQDIEPTFFERLTAGDVLFIDSSHVVKIDGDVPHLYLEVVPRLAPGVVIHSHDIPFPFNVPYPYYLKRPGFDWPMFWTEPMLLQALLSGSPYYRILLSAPLLRFHDEEFLRTNVAGYRGVIPDDSRTHFGSLWFEKTGGPPNVPSL